jgi:LysM repeat protein/lipoprotein-anchoring transpeptidase ErfK/SrfK
MLFGAARSLPILALSTALSISLFAQAPPGKAPPLKRVEPGLEEAVKWEWRVAPSDEKDWALPTPTPTPMPTATPTPTPAAVTPQPEIRPTLYEVKHGDALVLIGKKFGMTVSQIQTFNGLTGDKIRVGQTLKIPTLAELKAMVPPPPKPKAAKTPDSKQSPEAASDLDKLRLEIFLDREQFSAGPIVGYPPPDFARVMLVYQSTHDDAKDDAALAAKAQAAVPNVFARYKLRAEDFRFIAPPRPVTVAPKPSPPPSSHGRPGKSPSRSPVVTTAVPLTYQQLTEQSMLAYRTPWEFVAERFHCQEAYLHSLNSKLPTTPAIGADFQVPNVVPFEIENALDEPLQPQADPKNPVTAAVIGLSQLNIYQNGALTAVLPLSPARPGLHGRNVWTVLDVIPHPRLATFQKERVERTQKAVSTDGSRGQAPAPPTTTALASEQFLAAGPRNPVGILWINLAKAKSTDPLPYGLHGTSAPDKMNVEQSLGGFRLTNWDIARAVRHLPPGTPLAWK